MRVMIIVCVSVVALTLVGGVAWLLTRDPSAATADSAISRRELARTMSAAAKAKATTADDPVTTEGAGDVGLVLHVSDCDTLALTAIVTTDAMSARLERYGVKWVRCAGNTSAIIRAPWR